MAPSDARPCVLILDDDDDLMAFLCEVLAESYDVVPCFVIDDVHAALGRVQGASVIITDWRLGAEDGLDLLLELLEAKTPAALLLITAHAHELPETPRWLQIRDRVALARKPLDVRSLREQVGRLASLAAMKSSLASLGR